MKQEVCKDCYRIICKVCQWEATDTEIVQIQEGKLEACPQCGWKPGTPPETV
jgi:ribosome-binding protein aMBF1 (putative translation factor)